MEIYGNWKVIKVLKKTRSATYVLAECMKCGELNQVNYQNLKRGKSKNCQECRLNEKRLILYPSMKFNRWKAIEYYSTTDKGRIRWIFECDCGKRFDREIYEIVKGRSKQCDFCCKKQNATTHGFTKSRVYRSWQMMKNRCLNSKHKDYERYGARGIKLCESWLKFENFLKDMGQPPKDYTLDRIDVNGDYCKENCRWASKSSQSNNRRDNRIIEYKGVKRTVAEWAKVLKVPYQNLYKRYLTHGDSVIEKYID